MNDSRKSLLPALLAVGTGITTLPASALELGEINVDSTLGRPLRASIAYALGPNEQLASYCVTLNPANAGDGVPAITNASISVANGVISLTGKTSIREPLMTVRVNVSCPYTPNLSREYMLFINPAAPIRAAVTAPAAEATVDASSRPSVVAAEPQAAAQPAARRIERNIAPIDAAERYRVQPGDSLSEIAARIENRPVGLWDAVAQIFDTNPDAFIDNDPNKLKAGSWLVMPEFAAGGASKATFETTTVTEPVAPAASVAATTVAETPVVDKLADDTAVLQPATLPATADLQPGDVILDPESAYVADDESRVVIPDTEIDAPASTSSSPNVPTARIVVPESTSPSGTNWLLWLFGGGVALIIGLLLFGRRNRDLDGDPAVVAAEPEHPMRRAADTGAVEMLPDEDFDLSDDSPTEENLALDANLEIGTGLQEGADVDVQHDFAFASTTTLDLEFPFDDEDGDTSVTSDMISKPTIEESSILEQELLPDDEDYDMSVIVDATKMPSPEDVTERDLKAVVVDDSDADDGYTIDQEVDYQILEQDYEDELTATQALNIEIEKAAAVLADRMDDIDMAGSDDKTADMKLATVTELDATRRTDESAADEEPTADLQADEPTVEMSSDESTVEMPSKRG